MNFHSFTLITEGLSMDCSGFTLRLLTENHANRQFSEFHMDHPRCDEKPADTHD